jgi:hypothetical protein
VLDQLSDTDVELSPAQSGGAIRHLGPEDLESYASGRLTSARLNDCQTHLESCEACRAELEDLRIFKSEMSGFPRAEPQRRAARKRRSGLTLPAAASIATMFVAVGCTVLWWRHQSPRADKTASAAAPSTSVASPAAGVAPAAARATAAAAPAAAPAAPAAPATPAAVVTAARLPAPPAASDTQTHNTRLVAEHAGQAPQRAPAAPLAAKTSTEFALLGPNGAALAETRPEFSWQPLVGAVRYRVVIVDAGLRPVQRSPLLRKTVWRPRRPLRRGRTYLWQVTATLRGGSKVVASAPGKVTEL